MPVRIDPVVLQIRGYSAGVDIDKPLSEMIEAPKFVATVVAIEGHCHISALLGKITMANSREIKRKLVEMGFKQCTWQRLSGKLVDVVA